MFEKQMKDGFVRVGITVTKQGHGGMVHQKFSMSSIWLGFFSKFGWI